MIMCLTLPVGYLQSMVQLKLGPMKSNLALCLQQIHANRIPWPLSPPLPFDNNTNHHVECTRGYIKAIMQKYVMTENVKCKKYAKSEDKTNQNFLNISILSVIKNHRCSSLFHYLFTVTASRSS